MVGDTFTLNKVVISALATDESKCVASNAETRVLENPEGLRRNIPVNFIASDGENEETELRVVEGRAKYQPIAMYQ